MLIVVAVLAATGLVWAAPGAWSRPRRGHLVAPRLVVDPNTVPPEVLSALPQVGPAILARILEQREIRRFDSLEDMRRRVKGLGPVTLSRLAPHLRLPPATELTRLDGQSPEIRNPVRRRTARSSRGQPRR